MTNDKRPATQKPGSDDRSEPADENDTQGHSLLNAQLGGVMAHERARDAAKWAAGEQARKRQQANHKKDGQR